LYAKIQLYIQDTSVGGDDISDTISDSFYYNSVHNSFTDTDRQMVDEENMNDNNGKIIGFNIKQFHVFVV
jgi:hypothetical protein